MISKIVRKTTLDIFQVNMKSLFPTREIRVGAGKS